MVLLFLVSLCAVCMCKYDISLDGGMDVPVKCKLTPYFPFVVPSWILPSSWYSQFVWLLWMQIPHLTGSRCWRGKGVARVLTDICSMHMTRWLRSILSVKGDVLKLLTTASLFKDSHSYFDIVKNIAPSWFWHYQGQYPYTRFEFSFMLMFRHRQIHTHV